MSLILINLLLSIINLVMIIDNSRKLNQIQTKRIPIGTVQKIIEEKDGISFQFTELKEEGKYNDK